MTSATVAGGSFDLPRAAAKKAPRPGRERWLRYGIGVSIAAILATDAVILASALLEDDASRPARRGAAAASSSTPGFSDTAVTGEGFAAFDVPADLDTFSAAGGSSLLPASLAAPAGSETGGATNASPALTMPSVPSMPSVTPSFTAPRSTTDPGPGSETSNPPAAEQSLTAAVVETVTEVVTTLPQVGPAIAPVAETFTAPVVTAAEPVEETAVEQLAPATSTSTSTSTSPVVSAPVTTGGLL